MASQVVVLLASLQAEILLKIHGLKIHGGSAGYPSAFPCVRVAVCVCMCLCACLCACVCGTTHLGEKAIRPTETA